jgi:hypothetical protein
MKPSWPPSVEPSSVHNHWSTYLGESIVIKEIKSRTERAQEGFEMKKARDKVALVENFSPL